MVNVSFEELQASVNYRDEAIFDRIIRNIRCGGDFSIISVKQVGDNTDIQLNPDKVDGSTHLFFMDNESEVSVDQVRLASNDDIIPITKVESVISQELLEVESCSMIGTIEREMTRFYNYIRNLR